MVAAISRRRVDLSVLALATLFACGGGQVAPPPTPSAPSPLLGKPAPEFSRTALDGTKLEPSTLRGRVVVLEFFAEYCVPCRAAMPAAEAAHRERPSALFVGVSEDDAPATAAQLAATFGVTFPIVHDQGKVLAGRLRVSDLPATIVLDANGVVRWVGAEASTTEGLVRVIDDVSRPAP
jgi:cytochrome c biogenesis protein CcmG/thiol:disulfide interchange protein DsbE